MSRCLVGAIIAVSIISTIALALSCVAIMMFTTLKSDHQNRIQDLEKQWKNIGQYGSVTGPVEIREIKPIDAIQVSTTKSDDKEFPANLATDGDADTFMNSNFFTNPWWCADMGAIFHVTRVVVVNRQNCCWERANLRVGVTNTKPVVGRSLALDAYILCEEIPGFMGEIGIVSCPNGVSGQYLVVQFKVPSVMSIGEVEIYGFENKP